MTDTDLKSRLLARVEQTELGCWEWHGARNDRGYGQLRVDGRVQSTHRLSYEIHVGPIPDGLQLDHLCRNRCCCNPQHLEPVTPAVNTRRGEPAQRTHCPRGHAYDEANTYRDARTGRRACRRCHADRVNAAKKLRRIERGPLPPRTHCRNGHPFDDINTYLTPEGYRSCRACKRNGMRRSRTNRKGA